MTSIPKNHLADVLGGLLADKANVVAEIDAVKANLIGIAANGGSRVVEGEMFRATVSFGSKKVVDYKAILEEIVCRGAITQDAMDMLLQAYTQVAEGVPTVRCTARKAA